jgi:hypothetical protein
MIGTLMFSLLLLTFSKITGNYNGVARELQNIGEARCEWVHTFHEADSPYRCAWKMWKNLSRILVLGT